MGGRFHNGVTPCPVCAEPVNYATQSVIRFPEILGRPLPEFSHRTGVYHRACFYLLPDLEGIARAWEQYQRDCFTRRNHSQSLFNNVVAFDTERFLCYRYLNSFEHQLFGFPGLVDWHLDTDQLKTLYRFFKHFDEDTFANPQQVYTPDFAFIVDPLHEAVEIIRFWSLVLPMTVSDQDFVALGAVVNLHGDLSTKPQLIDFGRVGAETGIRDRSDDPEFIPDNLQGELVGFAPSQLHDGMLNLSIRIHPRDEIPMTLWEALELRGNLLEYAEAQELPWDREPSLLQEHTGGDDEDEGLPRWE